MLLWEFLSIFGGTIFWVILAISSIFVFMLSSKKTRKRMFWFMVTVLPSVILSRSITEILKRTFQIPRPCVGSNCPATFSFPSGHATVIFAVATTVSLHYKNWRLTAFMMIFATLVSISRIMLGLHRLEDIIVGSFIGILIGIFTRKFGKMVEKSVMKDMVK